MSTACKYFRNFSTEKASFIDVFLVSYALLLQNPNIQYTVSCTLQSEGSASIENVFLMCATNNSAVESALKAAGMSSSSAPCSYSQQQL